MDIEISKEDNIKKDNDNLHTPMKSKELQDQNLNRKNQNSHCCIIQIQQLILQWVDIIKKYNEDPDVIIMMQQMNDVIKVSNQTSSQNQFNFTPKQSNLDDLNFNDSFQQDISQRIKGNYIIGEEQIQDQVCLSPKNIERGIYFNENCSEIKQQINNTQNIFKCKHNEEFFKDFDQNKSKISNSNNEELPLISQTEFVNQSHKFDDSIRKRILSFKKTQHTQLEELRNNLADMKIVFSSHLQKEITNVKEELLGEHSQFNKNNSIKQDQINNYDQMIKQFKIKIEKLEQIIKDQNEQIQNQDTSSNSEQFIWQLKGYLQNDETEITDIEEAKSKIMEHIMGQIQQVQGLTNQLYMIEQNKKNMIQQYANENQSNKNKFGAQTKMLEAQIIQLKSLLEIYEKSNQQLSNELEQIRISNQIIINQELIKIGYIQMQQQQQLIYVAVKVLQQYINSTAFELNVAETLKEELNQLKLNEEEVMKYINNSQVSQENTVEYFHNYKDTIQKVVQILCTEYSKVINQIIQQRIEFEKDIC